MAADDLADALRARGLRMTPQRQRVLDAVRSLGHATPEEISASLSDVDVATVYRAVQLLESLGLVAHTHLGHGAPSYRPAEDEHIHVVCHDCGSVIDAPPGLAVTLVRRLQEERGFTVDLAHFTVFGRCAACIAGTGVQHTTGAHHHHGESGHDDVAGHAREQSDVTGR
jgi:Fur family ferric uptake transcriptional regulator